MGSAYSPLSGIAVAGGWGYIGQKTLEAAQALGLRSYLYDPGPLPVGQVFAPDEQIDSAETFYGLPVECYHLALHPTHRAEALERLFSRGAEGASFSILCEKPMVDPGEPALGRALLGKAEGVPVHLLFNFIELYDPMTRRILDFLGQFASVRFTSIDMTRSKDREDPANPRNYKLMTPIEYQESVHCLAFVLHLLAFVRGSFAGVFEKGLRVRGEAALYAPPNPEAYAYPVDGKVDGALELDGCRIALHTDFKRGAAFTKARRIEGVGDGRPFVIEAEYLEGAKWLRIDGVVQGFAREASTYEAVLEEVGRIRGGYTPAEFNGIPHLPNARFAWVTYLLSSMLWDSANRGEIVEVASYEGVLGYAPGFPAAHRAVC